MVIGIPKEIKDQEFRVSLTPEGVRRLLQSGHTVWIESRAGEGSGFSDREYKEAGAQVSSSKEEIFHEAELIVKVKEPLAPEYPLFHAGQLVFTYLHLAASRELTQALVSSGVTAIAYETLEDEDGRIPILYPMSEIAGRMSVQIGAHYLEQTQGGRGVLLGGVPGVEPAQVVILGAGVVGTAAIRIAVGMGASVMVLNLDLKRLRWLDDHYQGRVVTVASNQESINRAVEQADLVIGAVMVRGGRAPRLVSRSQVSKMKQGAVLVDVCVDQGGCFETTHPTSHSKPTYTVDGLTHYCVPNIPGIVPRTSTMALTNATLPFIVRLADTGVERFIAVSRGYARGVNIKDGRLTCQAVAEAHQMKYEPIE